MTIPTPVRRSWLLTPVSQSERVSAAPSAGADVVVLDLAEFVPEPDKPAAREALRDCLVPAKSAGAEVFVQIDPELMLADLSAALWPGLDGIVVTRADTPEQVAAVDAIISDLESRRGILPGSVDLVLCLETALGNHNGFEVANASSRTWGLSLGRADLVMDLRPEPSGEIHLMQYLMQRLVTLASATRAVPLGAWWRFPDRGLLASPENTLTAAQRGRAVGFKGSFCVLDNQVRPLNEGFTPSESEVATAHGLCEAYASATASGTCTVVSVDDRVLTPNIARQTANTVAFADACLTRDRFKAAAVDGIPIPVP
jgi:citrate lyase subunit beta/citryl-CoA lyase